MARRPGHLAAILMLLAAPAGATDFYVSPGASASGTGSFSNPWRLQTALNHPAAVQPGDTIWLRGGTYAGQFTNNLDGTSGAPIIVRQYPGERATLDGGASNNATLTLVGTYTWFWGFEIMSSSTDRTSSQSTSWPTDMVRGDGVAVSQSPGNGTGTKLINLAIHDTRQGVGFWADAIGAEIHGCLIYYNGWTAPDRAHGHGIYVQNQTGTKKITNNIVFSGFAYGVHGYGSAADMHNLTIEDNILFSNGITTHGREPNFLLGSGQSAAQNLKFQRNRLYHSLPGDPSGGFWVGYSGCTGAQITANYTVGNDILENCSGGLSLTGNTFYYNSFSGITVGQYPGNTFTTSRPSSMQVFVQPNIYEAGRANIAVYNWSGAAYAPVNVTGILGVGDRYEVRNAQNFFAAPLVSGTYTGSPIQVPLGAHPVAAPVGFAAPAPSSEFNAFVLIRLLGPNEFLDVPGTSPFHPFVTSLSENGVTAGCGLLTFCPSSPVARDQMAVLLLRSKFGSTYLPPPATGGVFSDVPAGAFAAAWIERLSALGISTGCGGGRYCPSMGVSRDQMAVFLLRTKNGSAYTPPPATGIFGDVPISSPYAKWIEQLWRDGLTAGCGGSNYCPTTVVTRGQMAVFLVTTFALP